MTSDRAKSGDLDNSELAVAALDQLIADVYALVPQNYKPKKPTGHPPQYISLGFTPKQLTPSNPYSINAVCALYELLLLVKKTGIFGQTDWNKKSFAEKKEFISNNLGGWAIFSTGVSTIFNKGQVPALSFLHYLDKNYYRFPTEEFYYDELVKEGDDWFSLVTGESRILLDGGELKDGSLLVKIDGETHFKVVPSQSWVPRIVDETSCQLVLALKRFLETLISFEPPNVKGQDSKIPEKEQLYGKLNIIRARLSAYYKNMMKMMVEDQENLPNITEATIADYEAQYKKLEQQLRSEQALAFHQVADLDYELTTLSYRFTYYSALLKKRSQEQKQEKIKELSNPEELIKLLRERYNTQFLNDVHSACDTFDKHLSLLYQEQLQAVFSDDKTLPTDQFSAIESDLKQLFPPPPKPKSKDDSKPKDGPSLSFLGKADLFKKIISVDNFCYQDLGAYGKNFFIKIRDEQATSFLKKIDTFAQKRAFLAENKDAIQKSFADFINKKIAEMPPLFQEDKKFQEDKQIDQPQQKLEAFKKLLETFNLSAIFKEWVLQKDAQAWEDVADENLLEAFKKVPAFCHAIEGAQSTITKNIYLCKKALLEDAEGRKRQLEQLEKTKNCLQEIKNQESIDEKLEKTKQQLQLASFDKTKNIIEQITLLEKLKPNTEQDKDIDYFNQISSLLNSQSALYESLLGDSYIFISYTVKQSLDVLTSSWRWIVSIFGLSSPSSDSYSYVASRKKIISAVDKSIQKLKGQVEEQEITTQRETKEHESEQQKCRIEKERIIKGLVSPLPVLADVIQELIEIRSNQLISDYKAYQTQPRAAAPLQEVKVDKPVDRDSPFYDETIDKTQASLELRLPLLKQEQQATLKFLTEARAIKKLHAELEKPDECKLSEELTTIEKNCLEKQEEFQRLSEQLEDYKQYQMIYLTCMMMQYELGRQLSIEQTNTNNVMYFQLYEEILDDLGRALENIKNKKDSYFGTMQSLTKNTRNIYCNQRDEFHVNTDPLMALARSKKDRQLRDFSKKDFRTRKILDFDFTHTYQLDFANFSRAEFKRCTFQCSLFRVDFSGANLNDVKFDFSKTQAGFKGIILDENSKLDWSLLAPQILTDNLSDSNFYIPSRGNTYMHDLVNLVYSKTLQGTDSPFKADLILNILDGINKTEDIYSDSTDPSQHVKLQLKRATWVIEHLVPKIKEVSELRTLREKLGELLHPFLDSTPSCFFWQNDPLASFMKIIDRRIVELEHAGPKDRVGRLPT